MLIKVEVTFTPASQTQTATITATQTATASYSTVASTTITITGIHALFNWRFVFWQELTNTSDEHPIRLDCRLYLYPDFDSDSNGYYLVLLDS